MLVGVVGAATATGCVSDPVADEPLVTLPPEVSSAHAPNCGILDETACYWIRDVIDFLNMSVCPELGHALEQVWANNGFVLAQFDNPNQSGGYDPLTQEIYLSVNHTPEWHRILAHEAWHYLYGAGGDDAGTGPAYQAEQCVYIYTPS